MPKPKGGLGRGLSALIPQDLGSQAEQDEERAEQEAVAPQEIAPVSAREATAVPGQHTAPSAGTGILQVPVDAITPNPRQPRHEIGQDELEELAASIREHGILQPLIVTRAPERGRYHLIAGERRWRAAGLAGLETVPAILKEASSRQMLELALVENLQRADLNPLEEAAAFRSLVDDFGLKQEDVAARVGKSRVAVVNALRLLKLPEPVRQALMQGLITEGHARAILQAPTEELQLALLQHILALADKLSVREVEALARRLAERAEEAAREKEEEEEASTDLYNPLRDLEDRFRNALGTRVQLSKSRRGGRLVIYFYSDEELDRIYGAIVGEEE